MIDRDDMIALINDLKLALSYTYCRFSKPSALFKYLKSASCIINSKFSKLYTFCNS